MEEEVKVDTKEEDIKGTREPGAQEARGAGPRAEEVTKGTKEEVKEGAEEPKDTREEVKEGTKDGTSSTNRQEAR